jgi:hypothetical protein|tara:strand:+ start:183 stop:443 length:261 start_codon:yes stop_codon:yes gene_type:complete
MELVKIQAVIDKRAIASDTIETLENKYYYSKSKGVNIKLGDMHIDHFLRSLNLQDDHRDDVDIQTAQIIVKLKQSLRKIKRLSNDY